MLKPKGGTLVMKTNTVDYRQCVLSLLQMIDDKIAWRESLTQDDKEYLSTIKQLATKRI